MSHESDDVYAATAAETRRIRESECAALEARLTALGREYRALVASNTSHREECETRLATLRWIRERSSHTGPDANTPWKLLLDQIISRVSETLDSQREVN